MKNYVTSTKKARPLWLITIEKINFLVYYYIKLYK